MAGCAFMCCMRPTLAAGSLADGPVKAAAVAAKATINFIFETWSMAASRVGALMTASSERSSVSPTLVNVTSKSCETSV